MPIPSYGAAPLAKTFVLVRGLALIAMVTIVGLTANFVAEIISTNNNAPHEVVAALAITCIATLYSLISLPFFWSEAHLGLFIMTGFDSALLLAFVIVSVKLGEPVSFLNCVAIANASAAANAESASSFVQSLATNLGTTGSTLSVDDWAGSTRANCYETKAIWGLCIVLCILFACSTLILPTLWFKARKSEAAPSAKSEV